ncbi:hypothetical protein BH23CHL3_BH23CHL3_01200 [soil metagenome]
MNDSSSRSGDEQPSLAGRFRGRDGVTWKEREEAPESASLRDLEERARPERADQLSLFATLPTGELTPTLSGLPALTARSSLPLARTWYRRELEQAKRPQNTISAYSNDLAVLEHLIGPKSISAITRRDIARFLGDANNRTTRKRRLTSVRRFFAFLITTSRVLTEDPSEGYYPHGIRLRSPIPLFPDEQERLLAAAEDDEPWSLSAIWLMMRLGITRAELLALERDHIDRTTLPAPTVYIFYGDATKQAKERHLITTDDFAAIYDAFLDVRDPGGKLFPVGSQAVNGMVERIRRASDIEKEVTPNVLRHTFAVEQARHGADQQRLLGLLGLADDPRNRASVDRYLRLASPPVNADPDSTSPAESAS